MKLAEDFKDAHDRHWCDAQHLSGYSRITNADHLYELSAERGLKAVLVVEGQPVEKRYRNHVDKLRLLFASFASGQREAGHIAMLPRGEPFRNWNINQRYARRGHFGQACVELHRSAARAVRAMLQHAIQGGQP